MELPSLPELGCLRIRVHSSPSPRLSWRQNSSSSLQGPQAKGLSSSEVCRFVYNGELWTKHSLSQCSSRGYLRVTGQTGSKVGPCWRQKTEGRVFGASVSDWWPLMREVKQTWAASSGEDMPAELSHGLRAPGVLAGGFQSVPLARKLGQIWVKGVVAVMSLLGEMHNTIDTEWKPSLHSTEQTSTAVTRGSSENNL